MNKQPATTMLASIGSPSRRATVKPVDLAALSTIINHLEDIGYKVRWLKDSNNQTLGFFFFTHKRGIHLAKPFNKVVVTDATYKTNKFRLPFITMVGVINVGYDNKTLTSFGTTGAWVAKEGDASYIWVMEQLSNAVHMDRKRQPGLFVTDQAQALINAIES